MNQLLCKQLSIDYCCDIEDVLDDKNHFNEHVFLYGRRRYREKDKCYLKVVSINSKLLFCGDKQILDVCRKQFSDDPGEWFFEVRNLRKLDQILSEYGCRIHAARPFFIAEEISEVDSGSYDVRWYGEKDILQFRDDPRYEEAFVFDPDAPDVIGVSLSKDGKILSMAGASSDSPLMWQVGINTSADERGKGLGSICVGLLKNEILRKGVLPFYGTSSSHIVSQKVALNAGFRPAWSELVSEKID